MTDYTERIPAKLTRHARRVNSAQAGSTYPVRLKAKKGVGSQRNRDYDENGRKKPRR